MPVQGHNYLTVENPKTRKKKKNAMGCLAKASKPDLSDPFDGVASPNWLREGDRSPGFSQGVCCFLRGASLATSSPTTPRACLTNCTAISGGAREPFFGLTSFSAPSSEEKTYFPCTTLLASRAGQTSQPPGRQELCRQNFYWGSLWWTYPPTFEHQFH